MGSTLKPTPEAIASQLKLVDEQIKMAQDYAKHAADMIARGNGGREVALCITQLQQAKHWNDDALSEVNK